MQWYRNLKTVHKLLLEFGLTTALLATVGIVGVTGMGRMEQNLASIYQNELKGLNAAQEAKLSQAFAARSVRSILLAKDTAEAQKHAKDVTKYASDVKANVEKAQVILDGAEEKAELARTHELVSVWFSRNDKILQLAVEGKGKEALDVMRSANAATLELRDSLVKVCNLTQRSVDRQYRDSIDTFQKARAVMIGVSLFSVLCSLVMGFYAARSISVPLSQAAEVLRHMGEGRLTTHVDYSSNDEIGQMAGALNQAVRKLRDFLKTVSSSANDMAGASRELAAASRNLANGVNQHAAGQEETTVTLEQLSLTVEQNANNAAQASDLAGQSQKKAETGGSVVTSAVGAMDQVKASSHRIADIISTVDDIAFQTNLLALNAAVEAARAGELGRGFAVVAAEVRSLAQRSAQAAKEIKGLIQDSVLKVEKASDLVYKSGNTLSEILDSGTRVNAYVYEIANACKEQATSISQAASAVAEMGQVTHGNAAQTEELSATAHKLSETASQLEDLVHQFITT